VTATQGGGWTSIGTEIPAPKLLIPQSPMVTTSSNSTSNYVNQTTPTNPNGPNFPALAENEQPRLHSVLSDPEHSTTPANKSADDWINAWNNRSTTQPATIGRDADPSSLGSTVGQSQLVPLRSNVESPARDPRESTAARLNENWSNTNSFNQPQQNPPPASISKNRNNVAPVAAVANSPFNDQPVGPIAAQPNNQSPNAPLSQNSQIVGNLNAGNMNQNANSAGMTPLANNGMNQIGRSQYGNNGANEQQPWLPLVASVLTLAASLAANLYLGASYLDARQKYQSLVRKTAETFRRVKAVAA